MAHVDSIELEWARYEDLMEIRAYWESKREDRFTPKRADLDPANMKGQLPRIMLADVYSDSPLDFRYRLSGTGINAMLSGEYTAKRPRDLTPPSYGVMIHDHYCLAVRRREPLFHIIMLDSFERLVTHQHRNALPVLGER